MTRVTVMPSRPTARPENTEVTAKPRPPTMPTSPFAWARSDSSIINVTQVESAMLRADSTTAPSRLSPTNA